MSSLSSLITPSDSGYDAARLAFDLSDQRPAAISLASTVAEVQDALRYARDNGLKVANQATGHAAIALPSLENALLLKPAIDTEPVIDATEGFARVGAGTRWGPVVEAAGEHGLAAMHGSSPTVGVVGYLLGGGLSFYSRRYGLACNRVRAIEVVTADGEVGRVDRDNEPDLFWALRGGGGLFATVTAIELDLLPIREIFGGISFWPVELAESALSIWLDWTRTAPDSITTSYRIMNLPPFETVPEPIRGRNLVAIDGIAVDQADGEALMNLLADLGDPVMGFWGPMPAPGASAIHGDPQEPVPAMGNSTLLDEVEDELIGALVEAAGGESGNSLIATELRQLGGALRRQDDSGGVAGRIDGEFVAFGVGLAVNPEAKAKTEEDLARIFAALDPWQSGRQFYNFAIAGATLDSCFSGDAIEALKAIQHEYDPDRLFLAPITF